jgi:hypothetical protein
VKSPIAPADAVCLHGLLCVGALICWTVH